jgi:hypothetical protein
MIAPQQRRTREAEKAILASLRGRSFKSVAERDGLSDGVCQRILTRCVNPQQVPWPKEEAISLGIDGHSFRGPQLVNTFTYVRPRRALTIEFKKYPRMYGIIYGLLRYHSLTRDANDHPQTWVSVVRLAEEAGCTVQWVERTLREIERLGMISTEMRSGRSSIYTLLLNDPGWIGQVYDLVGKKSGPFIDI